MYVSYAINLHSAGQGADINSPEMLSMAKVVDSDFSVSFVHKPPIRVCVRSCYNIHTVRTNQTKIVCRCLHISNKYAVFLFTKSNKIKC